MNIRDAALSAQFKTTKLTIPEWAGQEVTVRELDARTRGQVLALHTAANPAERAQLWASLLVDVTLATVMEYDAEAKALVKAFEPAHRQSLMNAPSGPLQAVFQAACKISALDEQSVTDLEKN